ncbi:H-type lectin domain-containing protein [Phascolarctobacterium succinatutens]|uniref:H-type lectin domain-containing protein n=1 Tax=Phascolarctobacterium succinatutens TaxID=626940 RepID=UPI003CFE54AC
MNAPHFSDDGQSVKFSINFSQTPSVITAINQTQNSTSATQLFTASINVYATTSTMILHRYGGLTNSYVRIDWFAWGV